MSKFLCANGKPVLTVVNGKVCNLDGTPAQTIETSQKGIDKQCTFVSSFIHAGVCDYTEQDEVEDSVHDEAKKQGPEGDFATWS